MGQGDEPLIADFRAIAEAGATRTKLSRWMRANRDEFASMLETYRPRWDGLVGKFVADGLIDPGPNFWSEDEVIRAEARARVASAAKKTWQRIQKRGKRAARTKVKCDSTNISKKPRFSTARLRGK